MNKENYDIYRIVIKKREETNQLVALVEYYKNGKVIEQKRTTNPELITRILKTAANTSKNIEHLKKDLVAEYYNNGMITIENYDEIKSAPEFDLFNKKITKNIKKEKKQKEKLDSNSKSDKEAILSSIKNLKVTKDIAKLNKVKKITFKLLPLATLSVIVMTQIMPIVRNLPSFKLSDKEITMDVEQELPNFTDAKSSIINTKTILPELYSNLSNVGEKTEAKTLNTVTELSSLSEKPIVNEEKQNEVIVSSSELIENINNVQESNVTVETPLLESESQSILPEIEEPNEIVTVNEEQENKIQESNSTIETPSLESESQSILPEIEESNKIVPDTDSKILEEENIEEQENKIQDIADINTISNRELSSYANTESSEFPIFKSKSYIDRITDDQFYKIAAVIAGEDSYTYEGSLAAISTVLNRCDTNKYQEYGGDSPYDQLFYPSQFTAKDDSLAQRYMNHPEEIPDYVIAAVTDGLNGYRNHTYTSFRAGNGDDRVRIGENGNYYFNSSSEVSNYGYVTNTNKAI